MSVSNALEEFVKLKDELDKRMEGLRTKKELLHEQKEDELFRPASVWMMDSWSAADFISKTEENISKTTKAKNEIDLFIAEVYEELTLVKLTRLAMILKKLQMLRDKDPQQICPLEYTMERYEEWLECDPEVNTKESKILDALTKKIKLTQECAHQEEYHVMERGSNVYKFDMKKELERLQQKEFGKPGQPFVTDKHLSDYVKSLLKLSACNFEALKLKEFIDECQKEPNDELESAASPQNYQRFICAMSQHILNKYSSVVIPTDSDPAPMLDQIYSHIEEVIFPQVKGVIESQLENQDEKDRLLDEKYKKLANIQQDALGITEQFVDESVYPHCKAITEIMKIDIVNTPTQKLGQILIAAYDIINYMSSLCEGDDMVPGADEFMDIWVFVLLRARLPRFFTTVALLRNYSNPRIRLSESGYYMASFEFAGEYIRTLAEDFAKRSAQARSYISSKPGEVFFTPEISRFGEVLNRCENAFYVTQEEFCLKGFKLVIDYDLQLENARPYTSFLVEDKECCVFGSLFCCQQNSKMNSRWVKTQLKKVSQDIVVKTINGICIAVRNGRVSSVPRRYIEIPSGRYDNYRLSLQRNLSLERLGCINYPSDIEKCYGEDFSPNLVDVEELLQRHTSLQLNDYFMSEDGNMDDITEKVKDIQIRLRSLHCYSMILPCNGIYNNATLNSMMSFQRMHNRCVRESNHLEINGICDSRTFDCLCKFRGKVN